MRGASLFVLWLLLATTTLAGGSARHLLQQEVVGARCEADSESSLREALGGVACAVVVLTTDHLQLNATLHLDLTMRPQLTFLGGCSARLAGEKPSLKPPLAPPRRCNPTRRGG
jgi:hypothetical protein